MTVKIEVTAEDIERGLWRTPWGCPLFLAAQRAFPGQDVAIADIYLRVGPASQDYRLPLPPVAVVWRQLFDSDVRDSRNSVMPFTFEIEVPDAP